MKNDVKKTLKLKKSITYLYFLKLQLPSFYILFIVQLNFQLSKQ